MALKYLNLAPFGSDPYGDKKANTEKSKNAYNMFMFMATYYAGYDNILVKGGSPSKYGYIYSDEIGWIDMQHFFRTGAWGLAMGNGMLAYLGGYGVEIGQGLSSQPESYGSSFSGEDLGSNWLGGSFVDHFIKPCPKLSEQLNDYFMAYGVYNYAKIKSVFTNKGSSRELLWDRETQYYFFRKALRKFHSDPHFVASAYRGRKIDSITMFRSFFIRKYGESSINLYLNAYINYLKTGNPANIYKKAQPK